MRIVVFWLMLRSPSFGNCYIKIQIVGNPKKHPQFCRPPMGFQPVPPLPSSSHPEPEPTDQPLRQFRGLGLRVGTFGTLLLMSKLLHHSKIFQVY